MTSRYSTIKKFTVSSESQVSKPVMMPYTGSKDEFEDLKTVAGREFEYEYPTKKQEEPAAAD